MPKDLPKTPQSIELVDILFYLINMRLSRLIALGDEIVDVVKVIPVLKMDFRGYYTVEFPG